MVYGILLKGYLHITDNKEDLSVQYTEMPQSKAGELYDAYWKKEKKTIVQKWTTIPDEEEEKK